MDAGILAWLGLVLGGVGHFERVVVEVVAEDADDLPIDDMRSH